MNICVLTYSSWSRFMFLFSKPTCQTCEIYHLMERTVKFLGSCIPGWSHHRPSPSLPNILGCFQRVLTSSQGCFSFWKIVCFHSTCLWGHSAWILLEFCNWIPSSSKGFVLWSWHFIYLTGLFFLATAICRRCIQGERALRHFGKVLHLPAVYVAIKDTGNFHLGHLMWLMCCTQ